MKQSQGHLPTFLDPSGRRWRRLRAGALAAGIASTFLFLFVVTGVIVPPLLPSLPFTQTAVDSLGHAPRVPRPAMKHPISVRAERERVASRQRLFAYLAKHPAPPALRPALLPIARPGISRHLRVLRGAGLGSDRGTSVRSSVRFVTPNAGRNRRRAASWAA